MITIEPRLAQEIVKRTMQIIPFNVNVMNASGVIIGSGKTSRIGDVHAGAQLVLARKAAVEIDAATSLRLEGVKPGVNLPLSVRGQICGVVGLTGAPDAVRQFGELVRVTAEMILEQAQLTGELQRERRYREEFVYQLVKSGLSGNELEAWALRLGVDFQRPRAVVVIELIGDDLAADRALQELQRCQTQLAALRPETLMATISPRELVLLEAFDDGGQAGQRPALARQRLLHIDAILRRTLEMPTLAAMGIALPGIDGVALSYQSARKTLRLGRQRRPQETQFSYYELSLPVLLAGLDSGWQAEQLRQPLQRLHAGDRRGILHRTLAIWFANDGHPLATAKALHIHRNTLDYRMRKIAELTTLDLSNTDDRLLLYIALQIE